MTEIISQAKLLAKVLPLLDRLGKRYRKTGTVKARVAILEERIDTRTADGLETTNLANPGDYIVTNTTEAREMYVLSPETFQEKYKPEGEGIFSAVGIIRALELTPETLSELDLPEEFQFMASWDEEMVAKEGDFLACPEDKEQVYRIARKEFGETYVED